MQKIKILFIICIPLFVLSGCSSPKDNLENYYYTMAIGIDKGSSTSINLSIQIASNSEQQQESGSSQSTSSNIYTVPCNSIDSGISILNNYLSKKINLSHCSAIIFSEEIATDGIKKYINSLGNNYEIRPTCNIIISNTTSKDALEKISNSNEKFSSKYYEFIENSVKYTGYSINPELSEFFYCMNLKTSPAIATYAVVSESSIQNTGIAIFDEDKFINNLSVLDSISYSILTHRLEQATISIPNPKNSEELMDIELRQVKCPSIDCNLINNYPFIKINLNIEYSILSASLGDSKDAIITNAINQYVQEMILEFLYESYHQYELDLCNFRNHFYKKYFTLDEFNKIHWNEIFPNSYFDINVNRKYNRFRNIYKNLVFSINCTHIVLYKNFFF